MSELIFSFDEEHKKCSEKVIKKDRKEKIKSISEINKTENKSDLIIIKCDKSIYDILYQEF